MKATNGNPQDDEILGEIVMNVKVKPKKEEVVTEANFAEISKRIKEGGLKKNTRNRKIDESKLKRTALRKKLKQEFNTPVLKLIQDGRV